MKHFAGLILIVLSACGDLPSLPWNIRADCDNLPNGLTLVRDLSDIGWCTVTGEIMALSLAASAEPDGLVSIPPSPEEAEAVVGLRAELVDPYRNVWNHTTVRTHEAHALATGEGVSVLIVDTGIVSHQDLPAPVFCLDTITGTGGCLDGHGHGTHVAGIVAMILGNQYGGVGIAPDVRVGACKALDDEGNGTNSSVADCILSGARRNFDVINMSLGSQSSSNMLNDALDYAYEQGVVLVAACGNNGRHPAGGECENPGAHPQVISVAASDASDGIPAWVNGGADLAAPGHDILSTVKDNGYFKWSGTSMASPHVSGAAALYLSHFPGKTPREAKNALSGTARVVPCPSRRCGAGILDALALLSEGPEPTVTPKPPPTLPPPTPYPTPTGGATPTLFPVPTESPPPVGARCTITVNNVSRWADVNRWYHFAGAGYVNWLGKDEHFSFLPFDVGGGYMHISIAGESQAICDAFRTIYEAAGYSVHGD